MTTPHSATAGEIAVEDIKEWRGESVLGPQGDKYGKLEEVYYDTESDLPAFAAVKSGTFGKKLTFVPLAGATVGRSFVRVAAAKEAFKKAPSFEPEVDLTVADEESIYGHHGIGYVPIGQDARRLAKH
jgi:PRC-barrel domain